MREEWEVKLIIKGRSLGETIKPTPARLSFGSAECNIKNVWGGFVGTVLRKND